jgi:hypothetical protein
MHQAIPHDWIPDSSRLIASAKAILTALSKKIVLLWTNGSGTVPSVVMLSPFGVT